MPNRDAPRQPAWTPRRTVNVALGALAALGGAVAHLAFPGEPWAASAVALAAGVILGLVTPGSPVDAVLDRIVGPDDNDSPPEDSDARAVREALELRPPAPVREAPRPTPRRREGHALLDVLGAVVSFGIGIALLIARGGL